MAYRVEYDCANSKSTCSGLYGLRMMLMLSGFFLLFLFLVCAYWPQGRAAMAQFLFPGGAQPAIAAAEVFVEELRNGESISDALEHFCRDIVAYAHLP